MFLSSAVRQPPLFEPDASQERAHLTQGITRKFMLGCVKPLSIDFDYAQDPSPGSTPRSPNGG